MKLLTLAELTPGNYIRHSGRDRQVVEVILARFPLLGKQSPEFLCERHFSGMSYVCQPDHRWERIGDDVIENPNATLMHQISLCNRIDEVIIRQQGEKIEQLTKALRGMLYLHNRTLRDFKASDGPSGRGPSGRDYVEEAEKALD